MGFYKQNNPQESLYNGERKKKTLTYVFFVLFFLFFVLQPNQPTRKFEQCKVRSKVQLVHVKASSQKL